MAANEVPIDLVLRARDEMSAVLDRVAKETDGLSRSADKVEREVDQAGNEIGQFTQKANAASTASGGFSAKMVALGNIAADLAMKAMSAVGSAVGDVASAMINGNAEFERYTVQFGVLLGGADKAKDRLAELAEFGAKTPFELPEVIRADKTLQAFGLHSEESAKKFGLSGKEIRRIAGDISAGTETPFEDIARYLGQLSTGQTGEVLSRFEELGIVTREKLAEMGLEFSKSGELMTPIAKAFPIIVAAADKTFKGMMDEQSKTFEGMVSNLNDWRNTTLRELGKPLFDALAVQLGRVLEFLNKPETKEAITNVVMVLKAAVEDTVRFVETNWPTIEAVVTAVFDAIKFGYSYILKPTINFIIDIFEMVVGDAKKNFGEMSATITNVMNGIKRIIDTVLAAVWSIWEDNGTEIMNFVRETWGTISDIVNGAVAVILRVIEVSMPQIQATIDRYMTAAKVVFEVAWAAIRIVVGNALDLIKGIVNTILKLINGDTEGALNAIRDTFSGIWNRIYSVVSEAVADIRNIINEYLAKSGSSIEDIMNGIKSFISSTWTSITNDIDFAVGTIRNRTAAYFQEMRDNITLAFNQTVANIRSALQSAINAYNTVAPFLGYPMIPNFAATGSRGSVGGSASRNTTFNITAQYGYQDERSLREDVRTLQMLYGGA